MSSTWSATRLAQYLATEKARVDELLRASLPRVEDYPRAADVARAMQHAVMAGGKRLRAILIFAVAELLGAGEKRVKELALAVEHIHTSSLVFDDLPAMDDADLRRGQPTVHKVFGEATAILCANALLMLAFELLARAELRPRDKDLLIEQAARCVGLPGMIGGQAADLHLMKAGADLATVEYIHAHKTGVLFLYALGGAARACGANDAQVAALESYARNLGLAFQITDDLLDRTGAVEEVGKSLHKDRDKTTFVDLGGVEEARRVVEELVSTAQASLALFDQRADALRAVADFVRVRRY
ncbi:MAG: polyprenyl synthetase family protein [Planctomycetes bacterium]|nr:polyprenyl synthetase family protein [Planctomycetota bacterium]